MANIHDGHRKRVKKKFHDHGLESFTDIEALELLLMYAIPRQDTNELAHLLLNRFHSFRGVLEAGIADLEEVEGVGPNAAGLVALVTALNRRYLAAGGEDRPILNSTEAAAGYLMPRFAYLKKEAALLLCLDGASRLLCCRELGRGTAGSVLFSARDVVDTALRENAVGVILSHNHLTGTALPSSADRHATRELFHALRLIDVRLLDHIIVCDGDCVSMRDSGDFREF